MGVSDGQVRLGRRNFSDHLNMNWSSTRHLIQSLLVEFLKGFSLRTLVFSLDMVLPQLDAYHSGRRLQHLQSWVSVELSQQHARGQQGTRFEVRYRYEAYAQFHAIQLVTDGAPTRVPF